MKRIAPTMTALLLSISAAAHAQSTRPAPSDTHTFELTAVAPPRPALKYQLHFDDLADRRPGNAAILYFDAILLMDPDTYEKADKAEDALNAGDTNTFNSLADSLDLPDFIDELDLAARREQCDWDPPFRDKGVQTLLPHLNAFRQIATVLKVRAMRQIQSGRPDHALATLRLGYEMANKIGREPILVSGLVSIGITAYLNDALAELMSRPESPNLYWALAEFPTCKPIFRMDGERLGAATATLPALARAKAGEELSADQWHATLAFVANLPGADRNPSKKLDPVRDASPDVLRQARDYYAQTRHLSPEQAAKVDPAIALGVFYFAQYEIAYDGFYKLRNLPYPLLRTLMARHAAEVATMVADQPANPFLVRLPYADRAAETFARVDRQLAALTAVEALRSYAAAHDGALPKSLADITDTPVPVDPMTGHPFDYKLDGGTATLSSTDAQHPSNVSGYPLTYTIKIRK